MLWSIQEYAAAFGDDCRSNPAAALASTGSASTHRDPFPHLPPTQNLVPGTRFRQRNEADSAQMADRRRSRADLTEAQ
jgi:hypothetical protein